MTVELRELILHACLVEDERGRHSEIIRAEDLEPLKSELLAECEESPRDALLRQQERY